MPRLVVVELLDGWWLGVDGRGADHSVDRELEMWALIPESPGGAPRGDVLDAGPLLAALRSRVLPEIAVRVFPGTARHLADWCSSDRPLLTADEVTERVRLIHTKVEDSANPVDIECGEPIREDDGTWSVRIGAWTAECDGDGLTTLLRPTGREG